MALPTFPALLVNPVSLSSKTPWLSSAETAEATDATMVNMVNMVKVLGETMLVFRETMLLLVGWLRSTGEEERAVVTSTTLAVDGKPCS